MKPAIACIGHITHDKIITPRLETHLPGGTAFYFAHAMASLGDASFQLVTSLAPQDMQAVDEIRSRNIDTVVIPSRETVYFENKYGADPNHRDQRVLAKADPFTSEKLAGIEAGTFHLGTLLADDFSLETIKDLSQRGRVSVDAQGYLREVVGEEVKPVDWEWKHEAMPYINILKANEIEMKTITGSDDPHEAARILADWGVKEVLITLGDMGSLIRVDGKEYEIPAFRINDVVDTTGCGDTYMAGYLYARSKGMDYSQAGRFAAAMCSLKITHPGPFDYTPRDIHKMINS